MDYDWGFIFQTRCFVGSAVCSLAIDKEHMSNLASITMVEKLGLPLQQHPRPYRMTWLKECGKVNVTKQVLVNFTLGRYSDEIWCDVVPLKSFHILFGRPWRYEKKAVYDVGRNMYRFLQNGEKITLVGLTLEQSLADQLKVRSKEREHSERREIESKNKSVKEIEKENESREVTKNEVEPQEVKESESLERKEKSEESLQENKSEVERILVRTNNPLPSFAVFVFQVSEYIGIHESDPIGIPPNPGIEDRLVGEINKLYLCLDITLILEVDFVIPEETREFQGQWKEFICEGLSNKDDLIEFLLQYIHIYKVDGCHALILWHEKKSFQFDPGGTVIKLVAGWLSPTRSQCMDSRTNPFEERGDDMIWHMP